MSNLCFKNNVNKHQFNLLTYHDTIDVIIQIQNKYMIQIHFEVLYDIQQYNTMTIICIQHNKM